MADSNKNAALSFLKMAASGKVHEAYAKYIGRVPDGRDGAECSPESG
jgi:hypothetical protein